LQHDAVYLSWFGPLASQTVPLNESF